VEYYWARGVIQRYLTFRDEVSLECGGEIRESSLMFMSDWVWLIACSYWSLSLAGMGLSRKWPREMLVESCFRYWVLLPQGTGVGGDAQAVW